MEERAGWHIERVLRQQYENIVADREVFFNEPSFAELNREKADDLYYLIAYSGKSARFGLILGRKGDQGLCPFSAPYSYPVTIRSRCEMQEIDTFVDVLEDYCRQQGIGSLKFILPPLFCNENFLSGLINAFFRKRYTIRNIDLNYAIDLKKFGSDEREYLASLPGRARAACRNAQKNDLIIKKCASFEDYRSAYDIIVMGHQSKGYPVKLSFDQLYATMALTDSDAFIVTKDGIGITAIFLYKINADIVQGIYIGTDPDHLQYDSVNYLTAYLIKYYSSLGYSIFDEAISSENSIPNYGLCNFKESVGCKRSLKYTFEKHL